MIGGLKCFVISTGEVPVIISSLLVRLHPIDRPRRPFRLMSSTLGLEGFTEIVSQNWSANIIGTTMFHFNSKLGSIKAMTKQWLASQTSLKRLGSCYLDRARYNI